MRRHAAAGTAGQHDAICLPYRTCAVGGQRVRSAFAALETRLAGALALLNERAELCRQLADDARSRHEDDGKFRAAERQCLERAEHLQKLLSVEWEQPMQG